MPLTPGAKLRHYEVVKAIGSGGMGEVYRARDTTLGREVAIKVLHDELARDSDRLERFEREAKLLAQLNHTNIATIHGLEKLDGQTFLVMELVEGETLAERTARGPLSVEEAVSLFIQIAEGLQAAHEKGIIHRDLKPANIKLAPDGSVKILDFGLAKAFSPSDDAAAESSQSPTRLRQGFGEPGVTKDTALGVILGTAAYMSPEQARGKPVDTRTDVWAFGACLYEALTGARAFAGETVADVIGAVVHKEPDWSRLPLSVQKIVRRCLTKEVRQRCHAIGDARLDLEDIGGTPEETESRSPSRRGTLVVGLVTGAMLASVAAWLLSPNETPRNTVVVPRQLTSNPIENTVTTAALSKDGRYLAFVDGNGLFVRMIDTGETHQVETPDGFEIAEIDWYPDGSNLLASSLAGGVNGLWRISVLGGEPRKLADGGSRASISPDGSRIAYIERVGQSSAVLVMGPNGEEPRDLFSATDGSSYNEGTWSPNGDWLLFGRTSSDQTEATIEAVRYDGSESKLVLSDERLRQGWTGVLPFAWSSDNRLIYSLRENPPDRFSSNLWFVHIDPSNLELRGEPTRLTHLTGYNPRNVFVTPDGARLSFLLERFQEDVYVGKLDRDGTAFSSTRRLTFDDRNDRARGWLDDSPTVLFESDRAGSFSPYRQHLDSTVPTRLHSGTGVSRFAPLSADGEWILFFYGDDLMRTPVGGGPPARVWTMRERAYRRGARLDCATGARCLFGERDEASQEYVFYSLDAGEGKGDELARIEDLPPFIQWELSPDGRTIAVVNNKGGLRLVEIDTGVVREIRDDVWRFGEFVAWDAFGNGVYIDARPASSAGGRSYGKQLVYVRLGEETEVHMLAKSRTQWFVHPAPSPDGRFLAYGVVNFSANAWMLEDF